MRALYLPAAVAIVGLSVASTPAVAKDGFYVAPSAGIFAPVDRDFSVFGIDGTIEYDAGWQAGAAVGYRFGMFRFEIEGIYGDAKIDAVEIEGLGRSEFGDNVEYLIAFANGYAEFSVANLRPYLGFGVGVVETDIESTLPAGDALTNAFGTSSDLALQGEFGVSIPVTDTIEIAPSYRFIWVDDRGDGVDQTMAHNVRIVARISF